MEERKFRQGISKSSTWRNFYIISNIDESFSVRVVGTVKPARPRHDKGESSRAAFASSVARHQSQIRITYLIRLYKLSIEFRKTPTISISFTKITNRNMVVAALDFISLTFTDYNASSEIDEIMSLFKIISVHLHDEG